MTLYFFEEGGIPREPEAQLLPLFLFAHMIAIFLIWSIILMAMRVTIVKVRVECLTVQFCEFFSCREEVPPHSVRGNLKPRGQPASYDSAFCLGIAFLKVAQCCGKPRVADGKSPMSLWDKIGGIRCRFISLC